MAYMFIITNHTLPDDLELGLDILVDIWKLTFQIPRNLELF